MPEQDEDLDAYKPDVLTSGFTLHANEDKSNAQASESYSMQATGGQALGTQGEVRAFAKPQLDTSGYNALHQQKKLVDAEIEQFKKDSANFKAWTDKKNSITNLPQGIENARRELEKTLRTLDGIMQTGTPQQKANWQQAAADDQAKLDRFLERQANQPQIEAEIAALAEQPDMVRYQELTAEEERLTQEMAPAVSIAETSSPLFKNKQAMLDDPTKGGDRALLARSVATHQVDQLLGTNVIAEEKMAQPAGNRLMGVSVQADGAQIAGKYQGKDCFLQTDYSDPRIQKGMCDLEAVDYITGQIDRHYGNVFVNPETGKVTGIDNDLAFPEQNRAAMIQSDGAVQEKAVQGMPRMMSSDTADKILATRPDQLSSLLSSIKNPDGSGGLSKDEILGAVTRLQELQEAIKDPNSGVQVVKEFNQDTYNTLIQQQREMMGQEKPHLEEAMKQSRNDFSDIQNPSALIKNSKTSYLAGAVMEGRKYELRKGQIENGVEFGLRDADSAKVNAQKDPAIAEFKNQEKAARQSLVQNPKGIENLNLRREVMELQAQKNDLKKQLDACQKQLDKLDGPASLRDRAKSLFNIGRGEDQKRQDLGNQKQVILQGLKAVDQRMDAAIDKAMAPLQVDLRMAAKAKVEEKNNIAADKVAGVDAKFNAIKEMAARRGVNLDMVELGGAQARSQKEMVTVGGNKQINAATFRERSDAMQAKNSPAEANLASLKSDREAALGDAILKAAAVLHQGGAAINDVEKKVLDDAFAKVKRQCDIHDAEENKLNQERQDLYKAEVGAVVTPVLENQGFTPAEIDVFVEASVKLGMEMDSAALKNNQATAQAFAGQLKDGLETSDFKYSDHKPEASKLHDALYRANNTNAHVHADGDIEIKRGHASFQERSANKILGEVAAQKGVELVPVAQAQAVADHTPRVDANLTQASNETSETKPRVSEKTGLQRATSLPALGGAQWQAGEIKQAGKVDVRASLGISRSDSKSLETRPAVPAVGGEGQKAEGVEAAGQKAGEGQSKVKQMVAALEKSGQLKPPVQSPGGKSVGVPRK